MTKKTMVNASVRFSADTKQYNKALARMRKRTNSFNKHMQQVGGMIAGAFAVGSIIRFGSEAVKLAGIAEGVEAAFNKLNRPDLLNNLKEATRGTVTELELMKAAVKAQNFKVPLEKLATFFEFATKRAAQTGESVDYLVQSIIDGIGRKSSLVLDNLGISATELQAEIKKVGDFGLAAGNIIERELGNMGDVATTTAMEIQSIQVVFEDLQKEIGKVLAPVVKDVLEDLMEFVRLVKALSKGENIGKILTMPMEDLNKFLKGTIDIHGKTLEFYEKQKTELEGQKKEYLNIIKASTEENALIDAMKQSVVDLGVELDKVAEHIAYFGGQGTSSGRTGGIPLATKKTEELVEQVNLLEESLKRTANDPSWQDIINKIDELNRDFAMPDEEGVDDIPWERNKDKVTDFRDFVVGIAYEIHNGLTDIFVGIGETLGNALSGAGSGLSTLKANILDTLADLAIKVGKVAIATGIGVEAIEKALNFGGGVGAIVAGVALIALGKAIKGSLANIASSAGGGSYSNGGGSTYNPYSTPVTPEGFDVQPIQITGTLEGQGSKLLAVLENAQNKRNRVW